MAEKKFKEFFKELHVITNSGTEIYFGPDGKIMAEALENCAAAGVMLTPPMWMDDSNSYVTYNLSHIVKVEEFYYVKDED